jgi:uncharacterized protein YggE
MKKIWFVIISLLAVVVLTATGCAVRSGSETATVPYTTVSGDAQSGVIFTQQQVGIWVNGDGKASATPDIAVISAGVEVQKPTVDAAQKDAATAMDAIMKVLNGNNIDKKDIQTQQYMIYPVWQWNDRLQKQELVGYRVTNMVTVKIRKIEITGSVIDDIAGAGGDLVRINDISFTVDDPSQYYKEARDEAVKNAQEMAQQMADAAGVKLGALIYMSSNTGYTPVRESYALKADGAAPAPVTPISPGELQYTVSVQMVYGMK